MPKKSVLWQIKRELHNIMYIKCQIKPRIKCQPSEFRMKINCRGHRLLIDVVQRNTKIDGMVPFYNFYLYSIHSILTPLRLIRTSCIRILPQHFFKQSRRN